MADFKRIKTITSHAGVARFIAECEWNTDDEMVVVGYLATCQRAEIPSCCCYSPTTELYRWNGTIVFYSELRHRRYEVFEVAPQVKRFATDEEATEYHIRMTLRSPGASPGSGAKETTMANHPNRSTPVGNLCRAGIEYEDSLALRRIAMTLHRWYELECGDGNAFASWSIERDEISGRPYLVTHHHNRAMGREMTRHAIPDRERGAEKRLKAIMARYPTLRFYLQGDPRGAPLYILRLGDVPEGCQADAYYSRGIAVYK